MCSLANYSCFLGDVSIQILCAFKKLCSLFTVELQEFFAYSRSKSPLRYMIRKYFLPFCGLTFHSLDCVL